MIKVFTLEWPIIFWLVGFPPLTSQAGLKLGSKNLAKLGQSPPKLPTWIPACTGSLVCCHGMPLGEQSHKSSNPDCPDSHVASGESPHVPRPLCLEVQNKEIDLQSSEAQTSFLFQTDQGALQPCLEPMFKFPVSLEAMFPCLLARRSEKDVCKEESVHCFSD